MVNLASKVFSLNEDLVKMFSLGSLPKLECRCSCKTRAFSNHFLRFWILYHCVLFLYLIFKKMTIDQTIIATWEQLLLIIILLAFSISFISYSSGYHGLSRVYLSMAGEVNGAICLWKEKFNGVRLGAECRFYCIYYFSLFICQLFGVVGEGETAQGCRGRIKSWVNLLICLYKQLRVLRIGVYREISDAVINRSYRSSLC